MALTPEERERLDGYDEGIIALSRALAHFGMSAKEAGETFIRASAFVAWDPITKTFHKR